MADTRRVLVTGGSGFVGTHAVRSLLTEGAEVICVGRIQPRDCDHPRLKFVESDLLRDSDFTFIVDAAEADTLLHLAWETRHGQFWQASSNLDWVAASLRLIQAFKVAGGRRIVVAGTCFEYNPPLRAPCVVGETPIRPIHLYSVAKDAFHRLLAAYAEKSGLSYAWGRIFFLLGPGEGPDRLVPSAIRALSSGEPFATGPGERVRDFMDSRDCGAAFARLALSTFTGPINISSGEPLTIGALMDLIGGLTDQRHLIKVGQLPARADESDNLWGDGVPLRSTLGFEPKWSLKQSVQWAVAYWQSKNGPDVLEQ